MNEEEVKKILKANNYLKFVEYKDGDKIYHYELDVETTTQQICQIRWSKPAESRLLAPEEMREVDNYIDRQTDYYKITDDDASWLFYHTEFNKKQDAKTAPIAYKQGYDDACKIKDAEFLAWLDEHGSTVQYELFKEQKEIE